jgi:hypothetical protein
MWFAGKKEKVCGTMVEGSDSDDEGDEGDEEDWDDRDRWMDIVMWRRGLWGPSWRQQDLW